MGYRLNSRSYGGSQLAQDYQSWALGVGRGFGELDRLRRCDMGEHHDAVGKAIGRPFGTGAVPEGFCRHRHLI